MRSLTSPGAMPLAAPSTDRHAGSDVLQIVSGSVLCVLQIWTEEEWAVLSEAERPETCTYAAGLGWVGAVPVQSLN
jgi:hypothetical protein